MSEAVENPSLTARFHTKIEAIEGTVEQNRTVADRITLRVLRQQAEIDLGGEGDPIPTTIRLPTTAELEFIRTAQWRKRQAASPEEADAIEAELAGILGDICEDPSLDAAFWQTGFFSDEVVTALIVSANREVQERIVAARSFRADAGGARASGLRKGVRKNAK